MTSYEEIVLAFFLQRLIPDPGELPFVSFSVLLYESIIVAEQYSDQRYSAIFFYCASCYNVLQSTEWKEMVSMNTITVRLNKDEARIYKEYAEFKNMPLSTLMKEALEGKIEEEIDLKAILAYEERLKNNEVEYISFDEVKKRLGM